ncbi:hypothetical protein K4S08_06305 [Staphylococcus epidermidis]|nr:hypothetical protein [Staphylococcus epidermidis]MCG2530003.1 hypothetical protein [Staphylococcus epidermidis]
MQFKLKEDKILEFLDLNFPQQTFEKGRLLIGQNKRQPLHVYYFGEKFLALLSDFQNNNFNHFIQNKKERVIFEDGHFI